MSSDTFQTRATIPAGDSSSSPLDINNQHLIAIVMSPGWTAAGLSFAISLDEGISWSNVYDHTGAELVVAADAGRYIALPPTLLTAPGLLGVRSGTTGVPVNQASDRELIVISHRYR